MPVELKKINKVSNSLNILSPYVGKMRPSLVDYLIEKYAAKNEYIYDPFAGSGTVLLQGWVNGFNVIGSDLNYYAFVLAMGKTHPFKSLTQAERALAQYNISVQKKLSDIFIEDFPEWVKSFFDEKTLKEIYAWMQMLNENNEWFLMSCLIGILHHQRPGFLSYPSSNGAPYLRDKKYPKEHYPEMYEYRNVYERLLKKVSRVYRSIPVLDFTKTREVLYGDSSTIKIKQQRISTIITSPPYMKSLTYARDNRLRLWFLGVNDWQSLDKMISPSSSAFFKMMEKCFDNWSKLQKVGDKCIIVVGDIKVNYDNRKMSLTDVIVNLSTKYYSLVKSYKDPIPEARKVVKGNSTIKRELILVLERNKDNG